MNEHGYVERKEYVGNSDKYDSGKGMNEGKSERSYTNLLTDKKKHSKNYKVLRVRRQES